MTQFTETIVKFEYLGFWCVVVKKDVYQNIVGFCHGVSYFLPTLIFISTWPIKHMSFGQSPYVFK